MYSHPLPMFLIREFAFIFLKCENSLYILNTSHLREIWFARFFPFGQLFAFWMMFFDVQKFLMMMESLIYPFFGHVCFWSYI